LIELLEIIMGLKNEICPVVKNAIIEDNFNRAIVLINDELAKKQSPENVIAFLQGKVDAYETSVNALMRK